MKVFVLLAFMLIAGISDSSAQVSVANRIDAVEMVIGQQNDLTLTVTAGDSAKVEMPHYAQNEMLVPGVEVLECSGVETTPKEGGLMEYVRKYRITSFEDTLYLLPPMKVMVDGKEYATKELALKVFTIDVDTTNLEKYFEAKGIQTAPFLWEEWQPLFYISLVMLLLLIPCVYLYLCLRDNKPVIRNVRIIKKILPHQKAMKAIEEIKADKMVSSENQKEYYTRLTDALRQYIDERYGFSAMEMTSQEIIGRLAASQDPEALEELRTLFNTADLVKFAKYSTLINENDMNLVNAIDFINSTKIENLPTEEKVVAEMSREEMERKGRRAWLIATIAILAIICGGLLSYVTYKAILLF